MSKKSDKLIRNKLIKSINKTVDEHQCLGAEHIADGILEDMSEIMYISQIENLINQYKKEELPNAKTPYHCEAEIAAGFECFIEWLKKK